jgi:hypothetical protein
MPLAHEHALLTMAMGRLEVPDGGYLAGLREATLEARSVVYLEPTDSEAIKAALCIAVRLAAFRAPLGLCLDIQAAGAGGPLDVEVHHRSELADAWREEQRLKALLMAVASATADETGRGHRWDPPSVVIDALRRQAADQADKS